MREQVMAVSGGKLIDVAEDHALRSVEIAGSGPLRPVAVLSISIVADQLFGSIVDTARPSIRQPKLQALAEPLRQ